MKKIRNLLWGLIFIVIGGIWALNVCGVTNIDIFFEGWWTLFIIVPCGIGVITERDKGGNLIGLGIGVLLLLGSRDILDFSLIWKLILPIAFVLVGFRLIFKDLFRKGRKKWIKFDRNAPGSKEYCATFSGQNVNYDGKVFDGAELTAVFGGVKCDLRGAIIDHDVAIEVNAIFGGVDLFLPANVNLQLNSVSVFGGTSDKRGGATVEGGVTVFVNSTCIFGGADIK